MLTYRPSSFKGLLTHLDPKSARCERIGSGASRLSTNDQYSRHAPQFDEHPPALKRQRPLERYQHLIPCGQTCPQGHLAPNQHSWPVSIMSALVVARTVLEHTQVHVGARKRFGDLRELFEVLVCKIIVMRVSAALLREVSVVTS